MNEVKRGTGGRFMKKATTVVEQNGDETTTSASGASVSTKHAKAITNHLNMVMVHNVWWDKPGLNKQQKLELLVEMFSEKTGPSFQLLRNVARHNNERVTVGPAVFCSLYTETHGYEIYGYYESPGSVELIKLNSDEFDKVDEGACGFTCVKFADDRLVEIQTRCRQYFSEYYRGVNEAYLNARRQEINAKALKKLSAIKC